MTVEVQKQVLYSIITNAGGVHSLPTYALLVNPGATLASATYAILSNHGSITAMPTYAIIANPGSVIASPTYALFANSAAVTAQPTYAILQSFFPPYSDVEIKYPFIEERFPECISFGSSGGPGFRTSVFDFDSGLTATTIEWERLRARYNVTFENATPQDIEELESFFYGMKGRAIGFRYKDWKDYQISMQNVLVGDGVARIFPIFKRYQSGSNVYDRRITKPVVGTVDFEVDGVAQVENVDFFINYTTGEIIFPTAPAKDAIGTLNYLEYDVPVRFDTDSLDIAYNDFRQLGISSLPLIEILI